MASRQDQLHSYQFAVQRVVSAVVMRDTDPAQSPFRRVAAATLVGALAAALGLAGAAVVGVLAGGGDGNWRDTGAVIVERESGARFVYRDGRLHPVLNYASALLAVGSPQGAHTVVVSRSALAGAARGVPLGIAGAPDSLPKLTSAPWTVCSRDGGSTLLVGAVVGGGRPLGDLALSGTCCGAATGTGCGSPGSCRRRSAGTARSRYRSRPHSSTRYPPGSTSPASRSRTGDARRPRYRAPGPARCT